MNSELVQSRPRYGRAAAACARDLELGSHVPRVDRYTGPAGIWEFLKIGVIALLGVGTLIALIFAFRGRRQELRSLTS
jgi:hypothetical protein